MLIQNKFVIVQYSDVYAGVALGFKIRGREWPLKQPKIKNWRSKCLIWGLLPAQEFLKVQNKGVMNDTQKLPEIQNWGSFLQNVHLWPHDPF